MSFSQGLQATLDATLQTPLIISRVLSFNLNEPVDIQIPGTPAHWLYQFSSPKLQNSQLCYPERWSPDRFQPIGNLFMVPADHKLHARSDSGKFGAIICQLPTESTDRWFEDSLTWTANDLEAGLNIRSPHIQYLLARLEEETRHPGFASEALAELIAGQVIIELAKYYKSTSQKPRKNGLEEWRLNIVDDRIEDFMNAPSLVELAQLCNVSVRYLTRAFRISRGCSIGVYIAQRRVEKAKDLLRRGESVKSTAYSLGFRSPASFCYAFRRASGETPGQYRKRMLNS
ncbi:MAG: AraC family transcriptional regulator [Pseudomonadales bacterium]|nr:AraC family transcriptional regulator [Pseudomonadales bacterium]